MSMNDEQFEEAMKAFDNFFITNMTADLRARDTAQREALARVEAYLECARGDLKQQERMYWDAQVQLAECSTAHANILEELRAFHAAKPWLVEQHLAEAVGLMRETLDEMFFEDYPKLEDFLSRMYRAQAEQQEAQGAQGAQDGGERIALLERELDRERDRADMAEVELQHARAALATQPAAGVPLTVWYGSMPESNGKTNWTAILHRKGEGLMDGPHMTIARSEYPDRVRYEADLVRHIIGELAEEPDILAYDADAHSGYKAPPAAAHGDEAVRKDAERYRWLRNRLPGSDYRVAGIVYSEGGEGVDEAIDAAMRAQGDGDSRHE